MTKKIKFTSNCYRTNLKFSFFSVLHTVPLFLLLKLHFYTPIITPFNTDILSSFLLVWGHSSRNSTAVNKRLRTSIVTHHQLSATRSNFFCQWTYGMPKPDSPRQRKHALGVGALRFSYLLAGTFNRKQVLITHTVVNSLIYLL